MKSPPPSRKSGASAVAQPKTAAARLGERPESATRNWITLAGFAAFLVSLWGVRTLKMQNPVVAALICMGSTALVNFSLDILVTKVYRRASTGLDWQRYSPSIPRTMVKFAGLLGSFGFIALLYWIFPEYHGDFYANYWKLLHMVLPWWLVLAIPYFYWMDARQAEPHDGYYQAGLAVLGQWAKVDAALLLQHALGWLVKGYFLALMFTYYTGDLNKFISYDFSTVHDFRTFYEFGYYFIFLIDVSIACVGYLISLRIFDTHLRVAEPTAKGWLAALVCYQPFWSLISRNYLDYTRDFAWGPWLEHQHWLYCLWGSVILAFYVFYVWATIVFGCRFSNLTHRGILTNGPYRWTKHPAYIGKNVAYWMTYVPFIVSASVGDSVRRSLILLMVNGIYLVRAKTEEAMLSRDPAYVEYKAWMDRHGILGRLWRLIRGRSH